MSGNGKQDHLGSFDQKHMYHFIPMRVVTQDIRKNTRYCEVWELFIDLLPFTGVKGQCYEVIYLCPKAELPPPFPLTGLTGN